MAWCAVFYDVRLQGIDRIPRDEMVVEFVWLRGRSEKCSVFGWLLVSFSIPSVGFFLHYTCTHTCSLWPVFLKMSVLIYWEAEGRNILPKELSQFSNIPPYLLWTIPEWVGWLLMVSVWCFYNLGYIFLLGTLLERQAIAGSDHFTHPRIFYSSILSLKSKLQIY